MQINKDAHRRVLNTLIGVALFVTLPITAARADNWALLIGIDQYDDTNRINPLGAAAADARALKKTLQEASGFADDHIRLLVSDGETKPTRVKILDGLAWLKKNAKAGDTVFVLYSGHGIEVGGVPYLLPFDTSASDDDTLTDSALPAATFKTRLAQIKAGALVLAFDMCRSEPRKTGKDITATDNKLSLTMARGLDFGKANTGGGETPLSAAAPVAITLYSCSPAERSYEWADKRRGYFSYFLEQGLRGKAAGSDGKVTALSLARYVGSEVKGAVAREEQRAQTPYPSLDGPGAESFVLAKGIAPVPDIVANAQALDTKARLTVAVNVPNAVVSVDSTSASNGKFIFNLLDEARKDVQVKVVAPGYDGQLIPVTLIRGQTVNLPVTLDLLPQSVGDYTKVRPGSSIIVAGTESDAEAAFAAGDVQKSISIYSGLIQATPRKFKLYIGRGIAYFTAKEYEKSAADFGQFITLRPAILEGYLNRAFAYKELGKREEGLADLRKVEALDKSRVDETLRRGLLLLPLVTGIPGGGPVGLRGGTGPKVDADGSTITGNTDGSPGGVSAHGIGSNGNRVASTPVRADIQTTRLGSKESNANSGPVQVKSGSALSVGENLSNKTNGSRLDALVEARVTSRKQPQITDAMKATNPKKIVVEFTVGANGASSFKIVSSSGNPDVDAAVIKACESFKWRAATNGGRPVESRQRVTFDPNG